MIRVEFTREQLAAKLLKRADHYAAKAVAGDIAHRQAAAWMDKALWFKMLAEHLPNTKRMLLGPDTAYVEDPISLDAADAKTLELHL